MDNNNNPWMGLKTYTEGQTLYGRYKEIQELSQAIIYNRQTVVYGMSGIGKSSLLNAGIFPVLRKSRFFPVNVRLIHKDEELSYSAQIIKKIQQSLNDLRSEIVGDDGLSKTISGLKGTCIEVFPKADGQEESLWKYLHRHRFMNDNDNEIHPVIVLDQFEEIFTLCEDEATKIDFFNQLADLINDLPPSDIFDNTNRIQESSQEQVEQHHSENDELVLIEDEDDDVFEVRYLNESNYRIVISLREEFLSYLERYTIGIPSMKYNRFGVNPLTVDQAYSIIMEPRPGLISHDVATEIISKVTGENVDSINSKDKKPYIHVDSAILSLFLSELYEMKESNEKTISLKLLQDTGDNIIRSYYEKSISDISDSSIVFLEDNLVTEDGLRDSIFESLARKLIVSPDELKKLKDRRIIHEFPWNNDGLRIEFMHDRLCSVIVKRKIQRKQSLREKQQIFDNIQARQKDAKTILADESIDIAKRVEQVLSIYIQLDALALENGYDDDRYEILLSDYAKVLHMHAQYDKAIEVYKHQLSLAKKNYGEKDPHIIKIINLISEVYNLMGDYPKSLEYSIKAISMSEEALSPNDPQLATTLNNLGEVYHHQGHYSDALTYYYKALKIREKDKDLNTIDISTSYDNIGSIYADQGDYSKALEFFLKSLSIREKILGIAHPDTATTYNNIGFVYNQLCDYSRAMDYYTKALEIRENLLGLDHPDTASSYSSIGSLYDFQGNYDKALEYFFKDLSISTRVLGIKHPDTATSYGNIGLVYNHLGEYEKALKYYFKELAILEEVLESGHPSIATTYNNIGLVYSNLGKYDNALEYLFKDLAISEKVLGIEHPDTATSYSNIGMVFDLQGDYDKALEYYFKALSIRKKVFGEEHRNMAMTYFRIARVYSNQGKHEKALEYYFKDLSISEKVLGEDHQETAISYNTIGRVYMQLGNYPESLKYFFKTLRIYEKSSDKRHAEVAALYYNIAVIYKEMKDYPNAILYCRKAIDIQESLPETNIEDDGILYSYNLLYHLYDKLGDKDNAIKYIQKAMKETLARLVKRKDENDITDDYNSKVIKRIKDL